MFFKPNYSDNSNYIYKIDLPYEKNKQNISFITIMYFIATTYGARS